MYLLITTIAEMCAFSAREQETFEELQFCALCHASLFSFLHPLYLDIQQVLYIYLLIFLKPVFNVQSTDNSLSTGP